MKEIVMDVIRNVNRLSDSQGCNRYIKKYPVEKVFLMLLAHQFSGIESGRGFCRYLNEMIGDITDTMSQSELSKKLNHRLPVDIFRDMYSILLGNVHSLKPKRIRQIRKVTRIIDSSALPATSSMTYAKHRTRKNGFKMHTVVTGDYLPDEIRLKNGNSSDKKVP